MLQVYRGLWKKNRGKAGQFANAERKKIIAEEGAVIYVAYISFENFARTWVLEVRSPNTVDGMFVVHLTVEWEKNKWWSSVVLWFLLPTFGILHCTSSGRGQ